MRILCVADDLPWPENSGYKIRLANILRALGEVGEIDLFVRAPHDDDAPGDPPPGVEVARHALAHGDPPLPTATVLRRWPTSSLPRSLLRYGSDRARDELVRFARPPYDLVWLGHAHSHAWFGDLVRDPTIVDLDNLEDQHIRHHREVRAQDRRLGRSDRIRTSQRQVLATAFDRVDERRWRRLQTAIVDSVQAVTLCSELDATRLGSPKAVVIPNGYELAEPHEVRTPDPAAPVVVMIGLHTYEPNADAAWFFAEEVLPRLREERPGARFRLVGAYDWQIEPLRDHPGVEIVGRVEDLQPELRAADLTVIPVRFGGGTRLKALEAFAWRIPVVSTQVGVEGIGVEAEEHYLRAETPDEFLRACLRVIDDADLRRRVTDAAHRHWSDGFQWSSLRPRIADLASRVAAQSSPDTA